MSWSELEARFRELRSRCPEVRAVREVFEEIDSTRTWSVVDAQKAQLEFNSYALLALEALRRSPVRALFLDEMTFVELAAELKDGVKAGTEWLWLDAIFKAGIGCDGRECFPALDWNYEEYGTKTRCVISDIIEASALLCSRIDMAEEAEILALLERRNAAIGEVPPEDGLGELVVLFIAANPSDTTQLALPKEVQAIKDRLWSSRFGHRFRVVQEIESVATQLPGKIMRYNPNILHFSGHGSQSGELVFLDSTGRALPAKSSAIADVFRVLGDGIQCVVLNACYSESQARLIASYIPAVVGMSEAISDGNAIEFAAAFYEALGYGKDFATALELGLIAGDLAGADEDRLPKLIVKEGVDLAKLHLDLQRTNR